MSQPVRQTSLPFFVQTVILLCAALIVAQGITALIVLSQPPPRPEITPMGELVSRLQMQAKNETAAMARRQPPVMPAKPASLQTSVRLNQLLSAQLATTPDHVRLWYAPTHSRRAFWGLLPSEPADHRTVDGVPVRNGEPIFFGFVSAAWFDGHHWVAVQTAVPPRLTPWQQRVALLFGAQILFLLPLAWYFARRVTKPIDRFAIAAHRLGRHEGVTAIPEEGPLELRLAARAMNTMQGEIEGYLRERTAMVGAIAHDLRTPLARIAFRMEQGPPDLRDRVQGDIDSMQQMISDTLAFIRGTSGLATRAPVDLAALSKKISEAFAASGQTIHLQDAQSPVWVSGDVLALERLVTNLVTNALSYGKNVSVRVMASADSPGLTVSDAGPGIPEDQIARMFEAFERGDPSRNRESGGVGLGLAIARNIAQSHGASLVLKNRAEGGLDAELRFPPIS